MIRPINKIAIYYRDLPSCLSSYISEDKKLALRKDGVLPFRDIRVPRVTIEIERTSPHEDRERARKLIKLLTELESNNQILGFSA